MGGDIAILSRRQTCRLCDSGDVYLAVPMKPTPIADAYVTAKEAARVQDCYPLDLYLCRTCGHVQLLDVVDPEILFGRYIYFTVNSLGLTQHFRDYAAQLLAQFAVPERALAVDVGSNDGTLLRIFKEHGLRVVGVDPAREIAWRATEAGVETIPAFFSPAVAEGIHDRHGPAAIVTANNVFAHADDLAAILYGVRKLLAGDGVFVFEVSYIVDIVQKCLFDTIYHEHLCYHSVTPLTSFFRRHGMELFDVERIPSKGGSLRGFAQHRHGPRAVSPRVDQLIALEAELRLGEPEIFTHFAAAIEATRTRLHGVLAELKREGRSVAGFGASATVTTLIYQLELGESLQIIVDDNPQRHGLFSPGYHIPVLAPQALYDGKADHVVVLAWNYAEPIMKRHRGFHDTGGRFILPMPSVQIV